MKKSGSGAALLNREKEMKSGRLENAQFIYILISAPAELQSLIYGFARRTSVSWMTQRIKNDNS